MCVSKLYLRLHTASEHHWGVAIWINRRLGLLTTPQGPLMVQDTDIHVIAESKYLLIAQVQLDQLKLAIVSAYCPHAARVEERANFFEALSSGLSRVKHAHLASQAPSSMATLMMVGGNSRRPLLMLAFGSRPPSAAST